MDKDKELLAKYMDIIDTLEHLRTVARIDGTLLVSLDEALRIATINGSRVAYRVQREEWKLNVGSRV